MTYLLLNKPQRLAQLNRQRRHKSTPSGVCVIHTAEGSGANNVANYILNRTSYGSYHRIIDASTSVKLAPWSAETFHCRYTNPHSVGISAATFAANWNALYRQPGDPGHRIIDRMAIEAADFVRYMKSTHKITVPVKRITRSDALNKKPGFLAHGDTDPGRRTDPGKDFDWTYFFARINHHLGKSSTPSKSTPDTPAAQPLLSKFYYPSAYYVIDGKPGPATYTAMQRFLSDRGFYKRVIDGDAGSYTWTALQEFLASLGYFGPAPSGKQDKTTARALQEWLTNNGSYKGTTTAKWDKATWSAFQTYLRYAHKGTKVYKRTSTTDFKPTTPSSKPTPKPTTPKPSPKPSPTREVYYSTAYLLDGVPGPATYTALQQFLRDRGYYPASKYVIDGDAGPATWTEFQKFLKYMGHFSPSPSGKQDMTTARAVQQWLSRSGHFKDKIVAKPKWTKSTWKALQTYLRYAHKDTKTYPINT